MENIIYTKSHIAITKKLKQVRIEQKLNQSEVAEKLGRTQSYVSKIESGQRKLDVIDLQHFAEIYQKPINYFMT